MPAERPEIAPRRLILSLYGLYARDEHNWLSVSSVVKLMDDLGVDSAGVRSSIARLKRRGVLESMRVEAAAGYSLSAGALEVLREGDVRIFGPARTSEADDLVLVVFSVPEAERDRRHQLRSVLSRLGFGTVTSGVWIAPGALHDETVRTLGNRGLAPYVDVFRSEHPADLRAKVSQWWDLPAIEAEYSAFLNAFSSVHSSWKRSPPDDRAAFVAYVPMLTAWRRLPYLDPGLPLSVLPNDWIGTRAGDLFTDLNALLREPARRHATSVVHA